MTWSQTPAGKREKSFWSENFSVMLNAVISIIVAVSGYFFVTAQQQAREERQADHKIRLEAAQQEINARAAAAKHELELRKADAEMRRDELSLAKQQLADANTLRKWTGELMGNDRGTVQLASLSLAMAGSHNIPVLVAALAHPGQQNGDAIKVGLKVSALTDHAKTCNTLCSAARFAERHTATSLARAMGELGCAPAIPTLKELGARFPDQAEKIDEVGKALAAAPRRDHGKGYGQCSGSGGE